MDRSEVLNFDDTCTVLVFQEPVEVTVPGEVAQLYQFAGDDR